MGKGNKSKQGEPLVLTPQQAASTPWLGGIKPKQPASPRRSLSKVPSTILFTPYTYAKLKFMRDLGSTEVGGFGVSNADNPLLIEDFYLVKQECTVASVEFDDDSISDELIRFVQAGYKPWQVQRVWIHTHPGTSPQPSGVDETTFASDGFTSPDWAIMFILACGGQTYCRFKVSETAEEIQRRKLDRADGVLTIQDFHDSSKILNFEIDYDQEFPAADHDEWLYEYEQNVTERKYVRTVYHSGNKQASWPPPKGVQQTQQSKHSPQTSQYWRETLPDNTNMPASWQSNKGSAYEDYGINEDEVEDENEVLEGFQEVRDAKGNFVLPEEEKDLMMAEYAASYYNELSEDELRAIDEELDELAKLDADYGADYGNEHDINGPADVADRDPRG